MPRRGYLRWVSCACSEYESVRGACQVNLHDVLGAGIVLVMESIGARVRQRRERLGLTQEEVATQLGASRQWLSQLELGADTTTKRAALLAQALQCRLVWLLTGTGPEVGR
jgi:DNA-binding XRE family transcriptional regulator